MLKESDILFEIGDYWVCKDKQLDCYLIMQNGVTYSKEIARTYFKDEVGLQKATRIAVCRYNSEKKSNE